jgi:hypothetical protein
MGCGTPRPNGNGDPNEGKARCYSVAQWCQASLSMALLSGSFPTAETYRERTTLTPTRAKSTQSV